MTVGQVVHEIFHSRDIRRRIFYTLWILFAFRLIAHVPIPGANVQALGGEMNQLLSIFSLLTGGGLEQLSIVMMGLSPYITASIIIQLLTVVIPKWEQLSKEGERGQRIINKWTRVLTVPLAFVQSYGLIALLSSGNEQQSILVSDSVGMIMFMMFIATTGSMLLLWLGDQITEKGIGNGISVLIFAGIISGVPRIVAQCAELITLDSQQILPLIFAALFALALIVFIVLIADGQRKIPVSYAGKSVSGQSGILGNSFIPIPVNQAGMIPIIFAVSLLALPGLLANFLSAAKTKWVADISKWTVTNFIPSSPWYLITYFFLIIAFTYFYVSITFNPEQVAENIQKRGGFIPGIRPGKQTSKYLGGISRRLTLLGSFSIAIIALLPMAMPLLNESTGLTNQIPVLISGAGLIIIVGVVLELVRQINAQLLMQDYQKFT